MHLAPRRVILTSSLKFFGLDVGASDGTEVAIEYELSGEEGDDPRSDILAAKERLDLVVLAMEYAKGSLSAEKFVTRKSVLKARYDQLLRRVPVETEKPA